MRYIGGKSQLLSAIGGVIDRYAPDVHSVTDIFAGSGVVSSYFCQRGFTVHSNDFLYFSYVLNRGTIGLKHKPDFKKLGIPNPIDYLNNLTLKEAGIAEDKLFIAHNYSPYSGGERMYFQPENAVKIDIVRITIEKWREQGAISDDEYFYLLAALINAVPYVANITGVYAAYLKHWDIRTYNPLALAEPHIGVVKDCRCYNEDYTRLLSLGTDLLYADPPYNSREYAPNYHLLETIARYDHPEVRGVTGMRDYANQKSDFCSKRTVAKAFTNLVMDTRSRNVLISYNTEGLMPVDYLVELCENYAQPGSLHIIEVPYRRYKSKIPNNAEGLKEILLFFRKNV